MNLASSIPRDRFTDLLFIAMCRFQLGDEAAARAAVAELTPAVTASGDEDLLGFLEEARELMK